VHLKKIGEDELKYAILIAAQGMGILFISNFAEHKPLIK